MIYPGDRVLVKNRTPRGGTPKLRIFWEENIHVVISVGDDIPVYELKHEQGRGRLRIGHHNRLLPCVHLPLEIQPKPVPNKMTAGTAAENTNQDESEDEDECAYYHL